MWSLVLSESLSYLATSCLSRSTIPFIITKSCTQRTHLNRLECNNRLLATSTILCGTIHNNVSTQSNDDSKENVQEMTLQQQRSRIAKTFTTSKDRYMLQFDGGCRGNPGGIGGYGFVLRDESGEKIWEAYGYLEKATNNEAEYNGLLSGLRYAQKLGINSLHVEGDSLLVVRQMKGEYAVKANNLKPLHKEASFLSNHFQEFSIQYIPRAENVWADKLANEAMDRRESLGL